MPLGIHTSTKKKGDGKEEKVEEKKAEKGKESKAEKKAAGKEEKKAEGKEEKKAEWSWKEASKDEERPICTHFHPLLSALFLPSFCVFLCVFSLV